MTSPPTLAAPPHPPDLARHVARALRSASRRASPFEHWLLADVLTSDDAAAALALPMKPVACGDNLGRRETHNAVRRFFSELNLRRFAVCDRIARAFQSAAAVEAVEQVCGARLRGSSLRIEFCQDRDGFWLEPHTDIGAKLVTLLIYLSDSPDSAHWGTDLYDAQLRLSGRAPWGQNRGLLFVPGADTWHGFAKRPIAGTRTSLIVNYVKPEWRARHELAFPQCPVGETP